MMAIPSLHDHPLVTPLPCSPLVALLTSGNPTVVSFSGNGDIYYSLVSLPHLSELVMSIKYTIQQISKLPKIPLQPLVSCFSHIADLLSSLRLVYHSVRGQLSNA